MKQVRSWIEDKVLEWADKIDEGRRELNFTPLACTPNHGKTEARTRNQIAAALSGSNTMLLAPRLSTDRDIPNDQDLQDHVAPPIPLEDIVMDKYDTY